MDTYMKKCSTTNVGVQGGATIFKCPSCGEQEIIRSRYTKRLGTKYKCLNCGFEGPN